MKMDIVKYRSLVYQLGNTKLFEWQVVILINEGFENFKIVIPEPQ